MLKINRQTDYAVRVILALACQNPGVRLSSVEIQTEMLIPKSFMPRIVAQLANCGLVKTFAGRDGGLQLARFPEEITLKDVVESFEGPLLLSECMQVTDEKDCPFQKNCHVRTKWGRIQAAMVREMASINFRDLANEARTSPSPSLASIIVP